MSTFYTAGTFTPEWKAKCDADPKACEQKKAEMRERIEKHRADCAADPAQCEAQKAKWKERMEKRRAEREAAAPADK